MKSLSYEVPTVEEIEESVKQEQKALLWNGYSDLQGQEPSEIPRFARYEAVGIPEKEVVQHPYAPEIR